MKRKLGKNFLVAGSVDSVMAQRREPWEGNWTDEELVVVIRDARNRRLAATAPEMARALIEVLAQMGRPDTEERLSVLKESIEDVLRKAGVRR